MFNRELIANVNTRINTFNRKLEQTKASLKDPLMNAIYLEVEDRISKIRFNIRNNLQNQIESDEQITNLNTNQINDIHQDTVTDTLVQSVESPVLLSNQSTTESRDEIASQATAKTEVVDTPAPVEEEQEYETRTTVSIQNHIDFTEGKITQEELESRYVTERIPVAKPKPIHKIILRKNKANMAKVTNFSDIDKLNVPVVQEVSQDKVEASEESKPVKVEKGIEDLDPETLHLIKRHKQLAEATEYLNKRDSERFPSEIRVYGNKTYDRIAKDFILSQEQLNNVQKELKDIVANPNLGGLENEKKFMDYVYDRVKLSGAPRRPN